MPSPSTLLLRVEFGRLSADGAFIGAGDSEFQLWPSATAWQSAHADWLACGPDIIADSCGGQIDLDSACRLTAIAPETIDLDAYECASWAEFVGLAYDMSYLA